MSNTNTARRAFASIKTWKLQHENDTLIEVAAGDRRKLELLAQSGYRWVHLGDASGWLQTHLAMPRVAP